ncbi:MAG: hypothetical protein H8E98_01580 [Bacteroidetes bacterium]|nr:hypothetical protein [Bacteroidota bacterium]
MKSSQYYQKWLQIIGRSNDVTLFFVGWTLGSGEVLVATGLLILRLIVGYLSSDLVYKKLKATIKEQN